MSYTDLLDQNADPTCLTHEIAVDHAYAVTDIQNRLKNAPSPGGAYYNPILTWSDIETYLSSITPMQPGLDMSVVEAAAEAAFQNTATDGTISYRYDLPQIVRAIMENTWEIPEPRIGGYY